VQRFSIRVFLPQSFSHLRNGYPSQIRRTSSKTELISLNNLDWGDLHEDHNKYAKPNPSLQRTLEPITPLSQTE
jgi:hypothetical protein